MIGTVIRSTGLWYTVELPTGQHVQARLRGKLRLEGFRLTNPVGVGDKVALHHDASAGDWLIKGVEDRDNFIIRESTRKKHHAHILAANVDLSLVVVTIDQPRTSSGFIDRFLLVCEAYHISAGLVFNKMDLLNDKHRKQLSQWQDVYRSLGYLCVETSATTGAGLDQLGDALTGKTTVLSGHSGSGKSTLLNALLPDLHLATQDLSNWSGKGQHTTTFAERHTLRDDTYVIDTPGIKELGIVAMQPEEVGGYFPEIRQVQADCKFHNCTHRHEPKCAVRQAADEGAIVEWRYTNYLNIYDSLAN